MLQSKLASKSKHTIPSLLALLACLVGWELLEYSSTVACLVGREFLEYSSTVGLGLLR